MQVTVVGTHSMIAQALSTLPATAGWRWLTHAQAADPVETFDNTDVVLNCAFAPALRTGALDPADDIDMKLALRLMPHPRAHLITLSTRMVYGLSVDGTPWRESMPCNPHTPYGRNKLQIEAQLHSLLGPRLTVLRLSNVFGLELANGRRSFMAQAQQALLSRGCISLDVSPFVARDFIPLDHLAASLLKVIHGVQPGCYNLGAGVAVPVGRVMQRLTMGLGRGQMLVTDWREHDPFALDIGRAVQTFSIRPLSADEVLAACDTLGATLRERSESMSCST